MHGSPPDAGEGGFLGGYVSGFGGAPEEVAGLGLSLGVGGPPVGGFGVEGGGLPPAGGLDGGGGDPPAGGGEPPAGGFGSVFGGVDGGGLPPAGGFEGGDLRGPGDWDG